MPDSSLAYAHHFRKAFALAEQARGEVEPNPMVGALVLRGSEVVGRGHHRFYGGDHAEVEALKEANGRGDTLLVTLEPCSTSGKTPPCTWAIANSSVRRVVIGALDPNPGHRGAAVEILKKAGREVEVADFQKEWEAQNGSFLKFLKLDRPWVIAKWAMSLDGKIAASSGDSKWVSGESSREEVWRLRGRCEAVATGVGTVLADDPSLLPREHLGLGKPPLRVVFDSTLRTPAASRLVKGKSAITVLVAGAKASKLREKKLAAEGCQVIRPGGRSARPSIPKALQRLREMGVKRLLLEAGSELNAAFLEEGCIDQVIAYVSPKLVGGEGAKTPFGGKGVEAIAKAIPVKDWSFRASGPDLRLLGFL